MNDVLALAALLTVLVGGVLLGVYLAMLPPRLFLRGEPWLTEAEFLQTAPAKAWCRQLPLVTYLAMLPAFICLMLGLRRICANELPLGLALPLLFFLSFYLPVGIVELLAGVSVLVPFGKARGLAPTYLVSAGAKKAGLFRLGVTGVVIVAVVVAGNW